MKVYDFALVVVAIYGVRNFGASVTMEEPGYEAFPILPPSGFKSLIIQALLSTEGISPG